MSFCTQHRAHSDDDVTLGELFVVLLSLCVSSVRIALGKDHTLAHLADIFSLAERRDLRFDRGPSAWH